MIAQNEYDDIKVASHFTVDFERQRAENTATFISYQVTMKKVTKY